MYQDSPGMTCTLLIVCISSPLDQSSFSLVEIPPLQHSDKAPLETFTPQAHSLPAARLQIHSFSIKPRSIPSRSSSPQISPGSRCTPALSPPSRFTHDRVGLSIKQVLQSQSTRDNSNETTRTSPSICRALTPNPKLLDPRISNFKRSVHADPQPIHTWSYESSALDIYQTVGPATVSLSGSPVIQSTTTLIPSAQQISPSLLVEAFQPSIATGSKSRRNSTDSCDSVLSCTQSSRTVNTSVMKEAFLNVLPVDDSCPSFPSSPSASQTIFDSSDWNLDHRYTINTSPEAFSASIWKRKRPAPLLLPQHEPGRSQLSISETSISFEISIELPAFSPDSITVAQRRDDNSIHIVADQVTGENTGHYERLIKLQGHDPQSSPSKEVTSKFDSSKSILSVRVIKLGCSRNRQHAVVCDNGSGLTGNKTYRLIL
ncbi:hypothetical protein MJO28_001945 [Puccinia striiformis f. sp. tritici]|uniref:Uncharacterized protein n=1 Tax=Puccinia striiformis f. sp. tritici TaxID=168172 RepID=A0ACC0EW17_9BASI|nr:hypothetical protein MJO28_001945 [Puccinia striiformis f. sp. tritici]